VGPKTASGAGHLLVPPGLGKSYRILWQVPEIFGNCGKIEDRCPKISVSFSFPIFLYSLKKIGVLLSSLPSCVIWLFRVSC
jgi:hypothetical protein